MPGFLGSTILEVTIGLAFVYLLLALMCTTVTEWWSNLTKLRAKQLFAGIRNLLRPESSDPGTPTSSNRDLLQEFYEHPLIQSLHEHGHLPSYIPSRTFALALIDLLATNGDGDIVAQLQAGIGQLSDDRVRKALSALMLTDRLDLATVHARLEKWYDDTMDRVTGWYKRHTQVYALIVAALVTVFFNADTLEIAGKLWTEPEVREEVVQQARSHTPLVEYKDDDDPVSEPTQATTAESGDALPNPTMKELLGWEEDRSDWEHRHGNVSDKSCHWLWMVLSHHLLGWILTTLAVSQGAPFWFDILKRIMSIRNAGKPPEDSTVKQQEQNGTPQSQTGNSR